MVFKELLKEVKIISLYVTLSITLTSTLLYNYSYEILYLLSLLLKINYIKFNFITTSVSEFLEAFIYLSVFLSIILNIPTTIVFYLKFISKGLTLTEKKGKIIKILGQVLTLFSINFIVFYSLLPYILEFLTSFNVNNQFKSLEIFLQLKIKEYILNLISITFWINSALLVLLLSVKKINKNYFLKNKSIIFLFILILIALLTPPDILSLIFAAFPLYLFLESLHLTLNIKNYYR